MKKIILLALALSLSFGAFAQFSWGVKAGLNITSITGDDVDAKSKVGFNAGAFAEYSINDWFAISPELLYSAQGCKGDVDEADVALRFNYINIPILAKFYVLEKLSVETGPQLGFVVSAKAKADDVTAKMDSDFYNSFDFSWAVGATYNFGKVFANARYNFGLTDVVKEATNKNSVFQIGVGYRF